MFSTRKSSLIVSIKENVIYFTTLLICISLFYAFLTLGDPYNPLIQGNKEYDFTMYAPTIRYCLYAVSITIFLLVSYVNSRIFKEKLKEMSILITIGMPRRKIAFGYSKDILLISLFGFLCGSFLGIVCSYAINTLISVMTYQQVIKSKFIYPYSFLVTVVFFGMMYVAITFINVAKVTRWKPIDLLNDNKVPESKRINKTQKIINTVLLICCYFYIIYNFNVYFSIGRNYNGAIPSYESNKFQFSIFIAIVGAIYFTIKEVYYILILIKNKTSASKGMAVLIASELLYRLKSNSKNMLVTAIVLTMSLCGFTVAPLLAEFSEQYMEHRMVYDINIPFYYDNIEYVDDIPNIDYTFVDNIFNKYNIEILDKAVVEQYFVWDTDFKAPSERKNKYDMPRLVMGVSDYNQLRKMAGLDQVTLEQNSFLLHAKDDIDLTDLSNQLDTEKEHSLIVGKFILKENSALFLVNDNLGDYLYNTNLDTFLVFPDEVCEDLKLAKKCYFANTVEKISYGVCKKVDQEIQAEFEKDYAYLNEKYGDSGNQIIDFLGPLRFRSIEENDVSFMAIITKALGMYIGSIFMLICMAIISIKNIIECNENRDTYYLLHQLGMSYKKIKQLTNCENLFFYILPYIISVINFIIIQKTFMLRFGYRMKSYFEDYQYIYEFWIPMVLITVILILYVMTTQLLNSYKIKNSINKSKASL